MHVSSVLVGVQAPAEQNWPAGQTLAQEPQCAGSFRRSTHAGASAPHVERGAAQVSTGVVGTGPEDEPQPENKAMAAAAASTDRVIGAELRQGMVESRMDVGVRNTPLFIGSHGNGGTAKRSACVTAIRHSRCLRTLAECADSLGRKPGVCALVPGASWNSVPGTDAVNADAIASGGRGALWAASTAGGNKPVHVFRFDGRTWTDTAAPTAGALSLFSTATTVYGYGANGQIISHPR